MSSFSKPDFYCPFTTWMNPHHDQSWDLSRQWLKQTGLIKGRQATERLDRSGFSQLTAQAYPNATQQQLTIAINWLIWLFLFDDQLDECYLGHDKQQAAVIIDRLYQFTHIDTCQSLEPSSPIEVAFVDLCQEYTRTLNVQQHQSFMQNIRNYLASMRWEVSTRADGTLPHFINFIELRRDTGAVRMVLDLIEYCLGSPIPNEIANSLEMQVLKDCTIDVICMSNDLFSFEKEQARGDTNNLVTVWQHCTHSDLQEAADTIYRFVLNRQQLFIDTQSRLESLLHTLKLDEQTCTSIRDYVQGMGHWMRANLEFSLRTPRYFDIEESQKGKPLSWLENISSMQSEVFTAP
ncbi:hypothetical protein ED28_11305 [[Pantoea] beijingensis]|uniref:Terpene synthase n=1 Tax=[Pantoea] beijingensis TaxID=1324864 RepID=A0A443ICW7_9GAMM|nr:MULTISPECIES: terpene synthase family protein [Erwiniaceae]RWR01805.1 hypothetical protein ED28_11305 [[Pantoea] beijingensis]